MTVITMPEPCRSGMITRSFMTIRKNGIRRAMCPMCCASTLAPTTKIVILSGCMLAGKPLEQQNGALDAMCETLKSEGDKNIYRFDFTPQDGSLGYGADLHPSKAQHRKMANELLPFLRTLTGRK